MKNPEDLSLLAASDIAYIDSLYDSYKNRPEELDESWRHFFRGFEFQKGGTSTEPDSLDVETLKKEFNVFRLIQSFRSRGHLLSDTNPIRPRKNRDARISIADYGLEESDWDITFFCGNFVGLGPATLRNIFDHLKEIYCNKIGIEYMHSNNTDIRRWVREKFESGAKDLNLPLDKKKRILEKLNQAEVFESFLQSKFIGQKRFSLEGGESTIPALDAIITRGAELGAKEFVIGMAHRGRLNVLANIIGKTYEFIFKEFEGGVTDEYSGNQGDGDVKYHMGYTSIQTTPKGHETYLKILPNPSHLETIGPVVLGYSRAQIDIGYKGDTNKIVPIIIHGDAAVAGQGVVYESLQMSELKGYSCGGAIHFIINNQIGFTTDFEDARSSIYCTSLAKMLDTLILHVNGDESEHVVYACELAVEFRNKFQKDVFIDMVCYRKHGHNEGDEPKYTQPHLYGLVAKHKNPRELYLEKLLKTGSIEKDLAKKMQDDFKQQLSDRFNNVKQQEMPEKRKGPHKEWLNLRWSKPDDFLESPATGTPKEVLEKIIKTITTVPEGFRTLKKAQQILDQRAQMFSEGKLDWAMAELLAYGSCLWEGNNIRFSGQDVIRGTFSHRHAKVFDEFTNQAYCGLEHLKDDQGKMYIYNSLLSEYAVLGFEYGYSQGTPWALNVWEAQFGDFMNGAQIMFDQFISAAESKWRRMCGLMILLPHGYEGQGPEHSSARPERFLQLAAEYNMVIINPTTPAQMFHAIRRQLKWPFRKPLIVFTPKSLLRHPQCISLVSELVDGKFEELFDDSTVDPKKVKMVLMCWGKIYYQLLEHREKLNRDDVAIVRVEQMYPLPELKIAEIFKKYSNAKFKWVQEEPKNMGAWTFLLRYQEVFTAKFELVSRKSSASPAVGFMKVHEVEVQQILEKAFE
ncbi:MAG: 2-oxoglutarate dehydrogenase E1 component [Bacteriovoracaceae bacterium]